jgi:hypothetical protein
LKLVFTNYRQVKRRYEGDYSNLFASLNIPCIHQWHLKKREREVGVEMLSLARESCQEALREEDKL